MSKKRNSFKHLITVFWVSMVFYTLLNSPSCLAEQLRILHTNDVHGKLAPVCEDKNDQTTCYGGVSRRYTVIEKFRNAKAPVLLLDAGDFAQGSLFFNIYKGSPDVDFYNEMAYDAVALGNHEFDKGEELISSLLKNASFPFLSANTQVTENSPLYSLYKPYIIREFNGLKVGIIGVTTPSTRNISNPAKDTRFNDPVEAVNHIVDEIDDQTDLIVVLSHLGLENDILLAENTSGVDVIVGGHSHTFLEVPVAANNENNELVLIVQAGENGKYLGNILLTVENDVVKDFCYKPILLDHKIKSFSPFEKKVEALKSTFEEKLAVEVGRITLPLNTIRDDMRSKESSGGNFATDAIRYNFPELDIALLNGGSIRTNKVFPPGTLTKADIYAMHPFEDELVLFKLKGKYLKNALERSVSMFPKTFGGFLQVSGLTFTADMSKTPQKLDEEEGKILESGERVSNVQINGQPLDPERLYTIGTLDFIANGGNGHLALSQNKQDPIKTGITLNELLERYLQETTPLNPPSDQRMLFLNASQPIEEGD